MDETTKLTDKEQQRFQQWIDKNGISDLDDPDSHYDYRGAFRAGINRGTDGHWPDTFKQHGHPTFSVESQYSKGLGDGGYWKGDTFIPPTESSSIPQPGSKKFDDVMSAAKERLKAQGNMVTPAQEFQSIDAAGEAPITAEEKNSQGLMDNNIAITQPQPVKVPALAAPPPPEQSGIYSAIFGRSTPVAAPQAPPVPPMVPIQSAAMSDSRMKTNIKRADRGLQDFLSKINVDVGMFNRIK